MNPLAIPLPVTARRHGEIVGIIAGLACLPFALYAGSLEGSLLPQSAAALALPIVILSALAGAMASATADPKDAPDIGGVPLRVGARAGFFASLVGGACTVFAATLHLFGLGTPPGHGFGALTALLPPTSYAAGVIILALLTLPSSIFFGLTGALLAGMMRNNPPGASVGSSAQTPTRPERSAVFVTAIILTAAGYLSPLLIFLKPAPKPAPIAVTTPAPEVKPAPKDPAVTFAPAPRPPQWRYQKPDDFDTAEAARIVITDRRALGEVAEKLPVAMSPDGRRFAYCRDYQQPVIHVADLETLDVIASVQSGQQPGSFAWSPDSKMLLVTTEGADRGLMVLDVEKGSLTSLPQPRNARLPNGRTNWWDAQEILFASGDASPSVLNLDTLRVAPVDTSPKWKALSEAERKASNRLLIPHLPHNARWKMSIEAVVRGYDVPLKPADNWPVSEFLHVALVHPQKAYRLLLPAADVDIGDALVAANDGTKLIRVRQNTAFVYFFGVRAEFPSRFRVTMPAAPDSSLAAFLAKKGVAAFICSPLINPLNGKTIGPNRKQAKAIARIATWQDNTAEFWIDEDFLNVHPGDVVADLHTWEERKPRLAGELGKSGWFAVIDKFESGAPPPAQSEAPTLDRVLTLTGDISGGVDRVEKVVTAPRKSQPPANPPPPSTVLTDGMSTFDEKLFAFLLQHHAKSSRSDVNGLVADYGEKVDHFSHGIVDRAFIRKDELEYHAPGIKVTEEIFTRPNFSKIATNAYSANYSITYQRIHPDGGLTFIRCISWK